MAVVQTKSTAITNRDATPPVMNDARIEKGVLKSTVGSVAVGAADSANSYYPLAQVPSSAMVRGVYLTATAGMTTLAGNVGVFKNTAQSGTTTTGVVANTGSNTFFGSASSLASALNRSDVTGANSYTTDKREQPLWQAIGLSADPNVIFDIGVQVTTANTGVAGRVGIQVDYVDNGA